MAFVTQSSARALWWRRASLLGGLLLAVVAGASVAQRLSDWDFGVTQYRAAGAPPWLYALLTLLQALAVGALLAPGLRAWAAGALVLVPTGLVLRRALIGDLRTADIYVGAVVVLAVITLVSTLVAAHRERLILSSRSSS